MLDSHQVYKLVTEMLTASTHFVQTYNVALQFAGCAVLIFPLKEITTKKVNSLTLSSMM